MPIQTIPYTGMNQGFAGSCARGPNDYIRSLEVAPADQYPINFGDATFLRTDINPSSGGAVSSTQSVEFAGHTAIMGGAGINYSFLGWAIREVKTNLGYPTTQTLGNYPQGTWADIIEEGAVIVQCLVGTPVAGGIVYLRTVLNGAIPAGVVGGVEANPDGTNSFAITNAQFTTGIKDANGMVEVTMRIRNMG
jgi:hypothetical protein